MMTSQTVNPVNGHRFRSVLEYPFQLSNGHSVLLRILLPTVFPEVRARISFILM